MSNPINPDYPIHAITSVDELMDIAVAMEAEAARRYDQLARRTQASGQADLVEVFRQLAQLERDHERGLESWARREGRRPPVAAQFSWRLPETFGDEADDHPLDPYQALAIAVRNEERAFAFYSYLSALCAGRDDLSTRAEALAREELKHVALLRGWRRRAFHDRPAPARRHNVDSVAELRQLARGLESGSDEIDALAACGDGAPHPGGEPASDTVEAARRAGLLAPGALTPQGALALASRNAQDVLDTYLSVAEAATDQQVLNAAQELAEQAMARLALIRARMADPGD